MPIYEYQCESCEKLTEAIQRLDEEPLAICPHCGGPLKKLMSAPSFQFKGTGWYVTDYAGKSANDRDGGERGNKGTEASSEKATGGSAEAKSDSAPSGKGGGDSSTPAS